jgi:DNA-binding beta-propeller fold protein YncE
MKLFRTPARKPAAPVPAIGRRLEALEGRDVPATISVAGATINEVGDASAFVAPGSGGLNSPRDLAPGPDGSVYVVSINTNSVLRYDGTTGTSLGTFVAAGSGGLSSPYGLAFGPDNNLYVGSQNTNAVYEYSGTTGSGGLDKPKGLVFGADGNLYVSSYNSDSVLRYQGPLGPNPGSPLPAAGQTGATFVAAGSGGLDGPFDLAFGADGLYVASTVTNPAVLHFDGATGGFVNTFAATGAGGLTDPAGWRSTGTADSTWPTARPGRSTGSTARGNTWTTRSPPGRRLRSRRRDSPSTPTGRCSPARAGRTL